MWQEKLSKTDVPFSWCYSFVCHAHVLAVIILIIPTDLWSLYFVATNRSKYKVMKMKIKFEANERIKAVSPDQHRAHLELEQDSFTFKFYSIRFAFFSYLMPLRCPTRTLTHRRHRRRASIAVRTHIQSNREVLALHSESIKSSCLKNKLGLFVFHLSGAQTTCFSYHRNSDDECHAGLYVAYVKKIVSSWHDRGKCKQRVSATAPVTVLPITNWQF